MILIFFAHSQPETLKLEDYTLSLALFDFLPPLLSSLGLWLLWQLANRRIRSLAPLALAGAVLVVSGGFLKAGWKLLWVTTGVDHAWMSTGLFWCMGPGFILLAGVGLALLKAGRGSASGRRHWLIPVLLATSGVSAAAAGLLPAKALTLAMTVLGSLTLMVSLILLSGQWKLRRASLLITANIVITFALAGLARVPEQTAALQWIEELMNLGAQGAFALAMLIVYRHANRDPVGVSVNE